MSKSLSHSAPSGSRFTENEASTVDATLLPFSYLELTVQGNAGDGNGDQGLQNPTGNTSDTLKKNVPGLFIFCASPRQRFLFQV